VIEVRRAHLAAETAARDGYGKLLAYLARRCGDIDAAEDALADAFAAALERWPSSGVPHSPEAWLLVSARNRLHDGARSVQRSDRLNESIIRAAGTAQAEFDRDDEIPDERLAMMFACAHPALPASIRGPLILQSVLGFSAQRIASAFLVAPAAMSQRLVRAKRKMAAALIPLHVPPLEEMPQRLDAVLGAIYAAFSAGWDDPAGLDSRAEGFAQEALWLGRLAVALCPDEPEPMGLLALMLHAHARRAARRTAAGAYIALDDQDVALWDRAAMDEAEGLLRRSIVCGRAGRFQLEAAIQSAHAVRLLGRIPDWAAIVSLYDALAAMTESPVVAVNRAAAIGRAQGAAAGLHALPSPSESPALLDYQPYWAAKAEMLAQTDSPSQAREAYGRAIGLAVDPSVREYLLQRRSALG
jgi:RNA polymerase sigma-70 factor (ECF subfamily)